MQIHIKITATIQGTEVVLFEDDIDVTVQVTPVSLTVP